MDVVRETTNKLLVPHGPSKRSSARRTRIAMSFLLPWPYFRFFTCVFARAYPFYF